jgi:hypothetical protein
MTIGDVLTIYNDGVYNMSYVTTRSAEQNSAIMTLTNEGQLVIYNTSNFQVVGSSFFFSQIYPASPLGESIYNDVERKFTEISGGRVICKIFSRDGTSTIVIVTAPPFNCFGPSITPQVHTYPNELQTFNIHWVYALPFIYNAIYHDGNVEISGINLNYGNCTTVASLDTEVKS